MPICLYLPNLYLSELSFRTLLKSSLLVLQSIKMFKSDLRSRIALSFFLGVPLVVIPRDLMLQLEIVKLDRVSLCLKGFILDEVGADPEVDCVF